MPALHFRLTPVLRLRERQRETQRLAFAAIEEQRLRLLNELQQLEERLSACAQHLALTDGQPLLVSDLQLYGEFIQQLGRTLQLKRVQLQAVEKEREAQRLALLEADKEVKSLEQLRTRLEERRRHEEAATAQQQADEVGQQKYLARQRTMDGTGKE